MTLRLKNFSYRFADHVLNSKLALKQEIEKILTSPNIDISSLSRPNFNSVLKDLFVGVGWENQPSVSDDADDPSAVGNDKCWMNNKLKT